MSVRHWVGTGIKLIGWQCPWTLEKKRNRKNDVRMWGYAKSAFHKEENARILPFCLEHYRRQRCCPNNVVVENSAAIISQVANFIVAVAVSLAKPFPDISKIEVFAGENFRKWQKRIFDVLDMHGVAWVLIDPKTNDNVIT
ncbi:hypothetical protein POTOM_003387 [Populus tomentosa]|uniref:Uncharacterized protein n=1 Tax=Populus tomentosa TaxID=118781 RepID=A0A8X8DLN6_POPTO|nr:hypothetical protein POTOM_003387 [Populus tomentosa]